MNSIDSCFKNITFFPDNFPVVVEIPKGSKNKYEIDKKTGLLRLDRILYTSTHYPHNYGYIPLTLADDGDALDVLIISSEEMVPLSFTYCKAIGVIKMIDQGKLDYKILAVALNDPFYNIYNEISELPTHLTDEIRHFFSVYKTLEGKTTELKELGNSEIAKNIIKEGIEEYKNKNL